MYVCMYWWVGGGRARTLTDKSTQAKRVGYSESRAGAQREQQQQQQQQHTQTSARAHTHTQNVLDTSNLEQALNKALEAAGTNSKQSSVLSTECALCRMCSLVEAAGIDSHMSIYLYIHLSVSLNHLIICIYLSIFLSIHPSIHQCVYLQ